ncbi:MAG: hypothetical protein KGY78_04175 [Anaerolineae bacterium]|nr:hypothetical protein [Anaerolineae bacterium]
MNDIDNRYIDKAKKLVLDKFPEMAGTEPSVSKRRWQSKGVSGSSARDKGSGRHGHYVFTFEKDVSLPGGHSLNRLVRVTMDEAGEVVKLTSSK